MKRSRRFCRACAGTRAVAAIACVLSLANPAAAQPSAPEPGPPPYPSAATAYVPYPPPPAPPRDESIQRHDGFYLRLGVGVSYLTSRFESAEPGTARDSASGVSTALEIAIGGTVAPGLVVGGALISDAAETLTSAEATIDGEPALPPGWVLSHDVAATMLGPFLDWYFDAERGLHLQAAVGTASIAFREGDLVEDHDAQGWGAMISFGYELWIGDQWSLGVIARATWLTANGDDSTGTRWKHLAFATPGLVVGATLH